MAYYPIHYLVVVTHNYGVPKGSKLFFISPESKFFSPHDKITFSFSAHHTVRKKSIIGAERQ